MKKRKANKGIIFFSILMIVLANFKPIKALEREIIIHYQRLDGNYEGWNIWSWVDGESGQEYEFTENDDFGKVAKFTVSSSNDFTKIGFIVKRVDNGNIWAQKDVDADRFIEKFKPDGSAEIWVIQEEPDFKYDPAAAVVEHRIKSANLEGLNKITLTTNTLVSADDIKELSLSTGTIERVTRQDMEVTIFTKDEVNFKETLELSMGKFGSSKVSIHKFLHSKEFNDLYTYEGPLGVSYTKEASSFDLWTPTAQKVILVVDDQDYEMTLKDKGVYNYTVEGDLNLKEYYYKLTFSEGEVQSVDPYARAVTINGEKGVIVSPEAMKPENYKNNRMASFSKNEDAIIYEIHVRDYTIDPNNGITHKGKFLGLTEHNTTTSEGAMSGIDYIKSLGVTHVQFLPVYDFASIDEAGALGYNQQYNWGYDPMNYNVPEGSYASDPADPLSRIHELKQMIQAFHDQGLYVIMDVVYNHVYDVNRSPLHKTVPYYYFRYNSEGRLLNGTGVGNETASEQPMYQRFILDSTRYWVEQYNIDGYRFDLMGIHDLDTMNKVREQLDEIDPSIIVLGEGWDMGFLPAQQRANQKNAEALKGVAFFNDSLRDLVKGSVFEAKDGGFVNGKAGTEVMLTMNLLGGQRLPVNQATYQSPSQVVQYVEAHDNLTLFDKLTASKPNDDETTRQKRHNLATSMVLLAQGIPFIHGGQEILRSKQGDENSYISNDDINRIDYDRQASYPKSLKMFKDLVAFRKEHPIFRLDDYADINPRTNILETKNNIIAYQLLDQKQTYTIIFNANDQEQVVMLPKSTDYQIYVDGIYVSTTAPLETLKAVESVTVKPLTTMVLVNSSENPVEATKKIVVNPWMTTLVIVVGLGLIYTGYVLNKRRK